MASFRWRDIAFSVRLLDAYYYYIYYYQYFVTISSLPAHMIFLLIELYPFSLDGAYIIGRVDLKLQ